MNQIYKYELERIHLTAFYIKKISVGGSGEKDGRVGRQGETSSQKQIKEENAANTTKPEDSRTDYLYLEKKRIPHRKGRSGRAAIEQDPSHPSTLANKQEKDERSQEGLGAQDH